MYNNKKDSPSGTKLASAGLAAWEKQLELSASATSLSLLEPTLHKFRHTGPALEFLRKTRKLDATQRRGRWESSKPVRRWEEEGRSSAPNVG